MHYLFLVVGGIALLCIAGGLTFFCFSPHFKDTRQNAVKELKKTVIGFSILLIIFAVIFSTTYTVIALIGLMR